MTIDTMRQRLYHGDRAELAKAIDALPALLDLWKAAELLDRIDGTEGYQSTPAERARLGAAIKAALRRLEAMP